MSKKNKKKLSSKFKIESKLFVLITTLAHFSRQLFFTDIHAFAHHVMLDGCKLQRISLNFSAVSPY